MGGWCGSGESAYGNVSGSTPSLPAPDLLCVKGSGLFYAFSRRASNLCSDSTSGLKRHADGGRITAEDGPRL